MTKWIALFVLTLTAGPASAVPADEPANLCYNGCSKGEQTIWDRFQASRFADNSAALSPAVFSGVCYHSGYGYDPEHTHYGMIYLTGDLFFEGMFAFFYDSDPYANLTLADAQAQFPDAQNEKNRVARGELSGIADFSTPDQLWRYWVRSSVDGQTLYVIGMWGVSHDIFCRMNRHPAQ